MGRNDTNRPQGLTREEFQRSASVINRSMLKQTHFAGGMPALSPTLPLRLRQDAETQPGTVVRGFGERHASPPVVPPPDSPKLLPGKPSPVVLQAVIPEESIVLKQSAYRIPKGQTATSIPIFLYNFGQGRRSYARQAPKTGRGLSLIHI